MPSPKGIISFFPLNSAPKGRLSLAQREAKAERCCRFARQEGYGAFSVSQSQRQVVVDYIDRQQEHHQKWTFEQEYLGLLEKYGIEYDPQFVFG